MLFYNVVFLPIDDAGKYGNISYGTSLPYSLTAHCMVTLHDGRIMILGGFSPSTTHEKKVWIFNSTANSFTAGPNMIYSRSDHACALFLNPLTNNRSVLVAGGKSTSQVELLEYETEGSTWVISKFLCLALTI